MNMKKITAILLVAGFISSSYKIPFIPLIHAEETTVYEQASVVTIDNLDEYDSKAPLSWSCELVSLENGQKVSGYASFTIGENSIVKIGVKYTETASIAYISPDVFLYANKAMTAKKLEFDSYDSGETKTVYLPAGTYYIEATDEKLIGWAHGVKVDISVCALPVNKALSAMSKPDKNKSKATVTVTQALGEDLENIQYVYGAYDVKDNDNEHIWKTPIMKGGNSYYNHIATELTSGNTFTINKNGTYTIRVITKDGTTYSIQHKIEGLGTTEFKSADIKKDIASKKAENIYISNNDNSINHRFVIIVVITFLLITGGMVVFIIVHRKKVRYYRELSEDYKEQFTQKYSYFKKYKEKQSDMAKFRHDWKNHMLLLQEMLNQGEYEKAKTYFMELSEKTVQSPQKILTGNEIVDLILASKTDELEHNQIKLTCDGRMEPFNFMENVDGCILFSNLIDNAIEANLKLETGRYITITTNRTNKLLYVEISNPMENMEKVIETRFQSTKKESEKHGIGLRNVYEILRKYHIEYYIITNEQEFSIQMLFEV